MREAKKKAKDKKEEENGSQVPVVPIAGAVVIASVLGGPVCLMAGIKLGMVAALGGGIMGYTTGRLIEEHGEAESLMKGEYKDKEEEEEEVGALKPQRSKKRVLKRIEEYERFEANCNRLRQQRALKRNKKSEREREREKRSYSLDTGRRGLSSLEVSLTLEEKINLWRRDDGGGRGGGGHLEGGSLRRRSDQLARRNSLPALVEETEEESVSTKRRSKSIDSFVII